jgi:hypothetical protein
MSDDGRVLVEYTIDGQGKPDGSKWEAEVDEYEWDGSYWATISQKIAADHYKDYGPIGDPVEINIYQRGNWVVTVHLEKVRPIVTYRAYQVLEPEINRDDEEV